MTRAEKHKRRKQIADAIMAGGTMESVAAQFNVAFQTVRGACEEFGIGATTGGRVARQARDADIAKAIRAGASPREIAIKHGMAIATVYFVLQAHGLNKGDLPWHKKREAERDARVAQAIKAVKAGERVIVAAYKHGLGQDRVRAACIDAGVTLPANEGLSDKAMVAIAGLIEGALNESGIAAKCGITRERVRQLKVRARAAGIPVAKKYSRRGQTTGRA